MAVEGISERLVGVRQIFCVVTNQALLPAMGNFRSKPKSKIAADIFLKTGN